MRPYLRILTCKSDIRGSGMYVQLVQLLCIAGVNLHCYYFPLNFVKKDKSHAASGYRMALDIKKLMILCTFTEEP